MAGTRQDELEEAIWVTLSRQRNANFVHGLKRCGPLHRLLGKL
jgi:hypothetical protein